MSNFNNKTTAFIITVIGLLFVICFILTAEVLTDNSVMSYSVLLTWSLLLAMLPSIIFILLDMKYSLLVSCISTIILASLAGILIFNKHSVGFYTIDEIQGEKFVSYTGLKDYKDIIEFSGKWVENNSISVILYGKKDFSYEKGNKSTIEITKFREVKDKFINKVHHKSKDRKDITKVLLISEDFKSLDIKNQEDEKLFISMLNEIYYTKFNRNVILLLKVDNLSKLKENGFNRDLSDKSKKIESMKDDGSPAPENNASDNNTGDNNTGDNNTGDNNTDNNNTSENNINDNNTSENNTNDNNTSENNTNDNNTSENNTGDNNTNDNNTSENNTNDNNTSKNNTGDNNTSENNTNDNNTGESNASESSEEENRNDDEQNTRQGWFSWFKSFF